MDAKRTPGWSVVLAVLAALALAIPAPASASTDFFDGDFSSDWSYSQVSAGNGGSASMSVSGPDGNPGAYVVAATSVNANCGAIYAFAFKSTATYDPSTAGALATLSYSEDAKLIDGFGSGQATGPAILQGGRLYVLPGFPTGTDPNWHHMVAAGLGASNFIEVLGGPCPNYSDPGSHPDFSANGSTMTFGYFRANSQIDPYGAYSITAAIDNWSVSLGPIIYAALGDSYSAGEGVAPFFPDSNTVADQCHRSMNAYGFKINFPGVHLGPQEFIACSGALTTNILSNGQPPEKSHGTEPPQLAKFYPPPRDSTHIVNDETDMVTLSVGGNDLGFVAILLNCAASWVPDCSSDSYRPVFGKNLSLKQIVAASIPGVGANVSTVYGAIKAQAQAASIFVLGYPRLFDGSCPLLGLGALFSDPERRWLDSVSDALNAQIAASASASRVHFVSVTSWFRGHGVCSADPWINGFSGPGYSRFHPTGMGQFTYAKALTRYMKDWAAQSKPVRDNGLPKNPGESFVANGSKGSEAPADLTPSLGDLLVKAAGPVPCSGSQVAFVPGQMIEVTGGGYGGGASVTVRLQGDSYLSIVATATADSAGHLAAAVALPLDAPTAGSAGLTAQGAGAGGEVRQLGALLPMSTSFGNDSDFDEVPDPCDNCPGLATYDTTDSDGDGSGDACDPCPFDVENDIDGDGLCADVDPCPHDAANDADSDGSCESDDNCPLTFNPSQLDTDGDGAGDACDGAPSDAGVWAAPGEVSDLAFGSDKATLTWTPATDSAGPLTVHDVARGSIADLPFELAAPCIATGTLDGTATDAAVPAAGQGYWYLVHARNSLGFGTWGSGSNGVPRDVFGCP